MIEHGRDYVSLAHFHRTEAQLLVMVVTNHVGNGLLSEARRQVTRRGILDAFNRWQSQCCDAEDAVVEITKKALEVRSPASTQVLAIMYAKAFSDLLDEELKSKGLEPHLCSPGHWLWPSYDPLVAEMEEAARAAYAEP